MPTSRSDSEGTSQRPRRRSSSSSSASSSRSSSTGRKPSGRSRRPDSDAEETVETPASRPSEDDDFGSGVDEPAPRPARASRSRRSAEPVEEAPAPAPRAEARASESREEAPAAEERSSERPRRGRPERRPRREARLPFAEGTEGSETAGGDRGRDQDRTSNRFERQIADVESQTGMRYFSTDDLDFGDDEPAPRSSERRGRYRGDDTSERPARSDRSDRGERSERGGDRGERLERGDRAERSEHGERTDRGERPEGEERSDRGSRYDRGDRAPRADRGESGDRPSRGESGDRPPRGEYGERRGRGPRRDYGDRGPRRDNRDNVEGSERSERSEGGFEDRGSRFRGEGDDLTEWSEQLFGADNEGDSEGGEEGGFSDGEGGDDRRPRRRRRRRRRGGPERGGDQGGPRFEGQNRFEGAPRFEGGPRFDGGPRRDGGRPDGGRYGNSGGGGRGRGRGPGRGPGRDNGPRGQSMGRGRDRDRGSMQRRSRTIQPSTEVVEGTFEGVLELHPRGYGFLRDPRRNYAAEDSNPFVSSSLVEKYKLREGVLVKGEVGQGTHNQGPRLHEVYMIDGLTPEDYSNIKHFDQLTAINPFEQIRLETGPRPLTMRVMDLLCPIGKGQRALLVAPPRTGKTMLLQEIAHSVSVNHPEIHLMVLLIDERPEEVTEMRRLVQGEVIASSLDNDVESHIRISQLIIERAKRLAEEGKDVFILLDSITRLARAFNKWSNTGRTATGGLDIRALDIPKKLFGQARRFDEGGSLTVCGTALIDTGSKMDEAIFQEFKGTGNMEMMLSRDLADRRIWPSIDITRSGTRREEKILPADMLEGITMLRRSLISLSPVEAMEQLTRTMEKFPTNREFLTRIKAVL